MERMFVKEAALYIGVSEFKLYEMVRMKQIPHYRMGARIIFRTKTIDDWISDQEKKNYINKPNFDY